MADYHTVYKGPGGETTEWEDIQRKMGNLPPKEPVWKPDPYAPESEEVKDRQWLDSKGEEELDELDDEFSDDRFLEEYRQRRMRELQAAAAAPHYGTLEEIRGSEFVQQVTEGSRRGPTWVVVLLHKDTSAACQLLGTCLAELAGKHPGTKFVRAVATDCIPHYPDAHLPTVLLYHNGACKQTLVGLDKFGGRRVTPEQVALVLAQYGALGDDGQGSAASAARALVERLVADRVEGPGSDTSSDLGD